MPNSGLIQKANGLQRFARGLRHASARRKMPFAPPPMRKSLNARRITWALRLRAMGRASAAWHYFAICSAQLFAPLCPLRKGRTV